MKLRSVCLLRVPNFLLYQERLQTPLGILYIAFYLRQRKVKVTVCDLAEQPPEKWEELIPKGYDCYGLTLTTGDMPIGNQIGRLIKELYPNSLLIAGGAHPSALPVETLKEGSFDICVVGEGEQTMLELTQGKDYPNGIAFKYRKPQCNGKIHVAFTPPRPYFKDINKLPFPAWDLMDDIFGKGLVEEGFEGTCITCSRGCPFACSFCATMDVFKRTYRLRSVKNICQEIKLLKENYGVKQIRLVDELTMLNRGHFIDLCKAMGKLGIRWRTHSRADIICKNKDLLKIARDNGITELAVGVENPDNEVLKLNNKKVTEAQCREALYAIKDAGIKSKAYFIVGLPGESWRTVENMINWIEKVKPDRCTLSTFCPYPNCDIYVNPARYKMRLVKDRYDWADFWILGYENTDHNFIMETEFMTNEELIKARQMLYDFMVENGYKSSPSNQRIIEVQYQEV